MIIERKDYQASHASQTVSYEVTDDYGHTASLTPEQTESLYQWIADNALQLHKDVNGEVVDDLAARWKQPNTSIVSLRNGQTVETEVNGKDFDGKSGSILLNGKPTDVVLEDGQWREA